MSLHTLPKLQADKVALAERHLAELRLALAGAKTSQDRVALERCMSAVEVMIPVYRAFETFMTSLELAANKR